MIRRHPISTLPATLFPYATLFRSLAAVAGEFAGRDQGGDRGRGDARAALVDDEAAVRVAVEGEAQVGALGHDAGLERSEEHTSDLQSLMRISYAVFCLKKKKYKSRHYTRKQGTAGKKIIQQN